MSSSDLIKNNHVQKCYATDAAGPHARPSACSVSCFSIVLYPRLTPIRTPTHHHIEHRLPAHHRVTCLLFLRVVPTDSARDLLSLPPFPPANTTSSPISTAVFRLGPTEAQPKTTSKTFLKKYFLFFFLLGRP